MSEIPTSGHWLTGLWETIKDFGIYIAGMLSIIWGTAVFSLKNIYVTKAELSRKLEEMEQKDEKDHKYLADKIDQTTQSLHHRLDQLNDLLLNKFIGKN